MSQLKEELKELKRKLGEAQEEDKRLVRIIMGKSERIAELEHQNEIYAKIINKQHELVEIYNEKLMEDG